MEFYGSLDSILEYSLPASSDYFTVQNFREDDKQSDPLENLLSEKVDCLSDILAQIERDIKSRNSLSNNVIGQITQHYCYLKTKLYDLDNWQLGGSRSIESRRSKLESQLDMLNQENRQEQIQCWRDIALLSKEFRDWFKQYCDLVQRVKIIIPDVQRERLSGSLRMSQSHGHKKRLTGR